MLDRGPEVFCGGTLYKPQFHTRDLLLVAEQLPHLLDRQDYQVVVNLLVDREYS